MGRGSYTASDWASLRSSRKLTDASRTENVFTAKSARMTYDVSHITCRESRDSEDSPHATPVIIGFDVTASMGYLAKELSVHAVNQAVMSLRRGKAVTDPQFLCAAIGDSKSDKTPLQVTQFESDIRMATTANPIICCGILRRTAPQPTALKSAAKRACSSPSATTPAIRS